MSNFSISNIGKRAFAFSEFRKDRSWGKLFISTFFFGFDKCKSILYIVR